MHHAVAALAELPKALRDGCLRLVCGAVRARCRSWMCITCCSCCWRMVGELWMAVEGCGRAQGWRVEALG